MSYQLQSVTIRTNNMESGMKQITELWTDVTAGKLPILFDSNHRLIKGRSLISRYSNYASDESGEYDLSIITIESDFLEDMERAVAEGQYRKYEEAADDIVCCTKAAWAKVWEEKKNGILRRSYTSDYESTIPAAFAKDGKCHCYLYIAVAQ